MANPNKKKPASKELGKQNPTSPSTDSDQGRSDENENYRETPKGWNEGAENRVVNEEEQNRTVNTEDLDWEKEKSRIRNQSGDERLMNASLKNEGDNEKPDGGSEIENPHPIEGEDAESTEKKIPNM